MKSIRLLSLLFVCASGFVPNPATTEGLAASDRRPLQAISVDLYAPPDIGDSLMGRVGAETDAIWKPAGIAFDWHRVTSTEAPGQRHLAVTIDTGGRGVGGSHATLGRITFTPEGLDRSIHLSLAGIENLLLRTEGAGTGTTITHEILVGRALGRALSHEIGHYLLKSRAHTSHGLMRAEWPSGELFAFNRGGFELSPEERKAAARNIGARDAAEYPMSVRPLR